MPYWIYRHFSAETVKIVSLLLLAFPLHTYSQQADWFVLNDASHLFTPKFMEVDATGNSYVLGGFTGEAMFRSAQTDGKTFHTYTSEHWEKTFLVKYDASGAFQFLIKMRGTGSNSNYADPRAFRILADGRLAVAAYTKSGITIEDGNGVEHHTKGYQQMALLYFSPEGALYISTPCPPQRDLKNGGRPFRRTLSGRSKNRL